MRLEEGDISRHGRQARRDNKGSGNKIWLIVLVVIAIGVAVFGFYRGFSPFSLDFISSSQSGSGENVEDKATSPLTDALEDVRSSAIEATITMEELKKQIEFLVGANTRDNTQFRKINGQIQQVNQRISKLSSEISAELNNLRKGIRTVEDQIEGFDTQLQSGQERQSEINNLETENIEKLRSDLINLNSLYTNQLDRISELERNLVNINSRVTDLER